jgi:hypothetical protein
VNRNVGLEAGRFFPAAAGGGRGIAAGAKVGFYEKGNVRIRYAETGSGFPLPATPGGGLNIGVRHDSRNQAASDGVAMPESPGWFRAWR